MSSIPCASTSRRWLFREDFVDQQRGALDHAPGTAARTEAPAFATERDQVLGMATVATDPEEPMLESSALQVGLELLLDVRGQRHALLGQVLDERRVVLLHQPVEPGVLGSVALVDESTGGFPAVGVHRLRVLALAGDGSV
jgi:hypothetical protein